MFEKILNKLGFITKKESLRLRQENFVLKEKLRQDDKIPRPVLDVNIGDPAPENPVARREYIARCAAFHKDVLDQKMQHMISTVSSELVNIESSRDFDMVLKGTINALHLIREWGESTVNEHLANQTGDIDKEEVGILKEKLK